jgi:hypothetical protein
MLWSLGEENLTQKSNQNKFTPSIQKEGGRRGNEPEWAEQAATPYQGGADRWPVRSGRSVE